MNEVYFSTDVETDGPIPGPYSMLSLASVAFDKFGTELGSFTMNLDLLHEATSDPDTMAWWATQPEAWEACRKDPRNPGWVMKAFIDWVKSFPGKPVFVAYPAGFDFLFVYWYLIRFAGESPFSFSALDIKTFAMARLGCGYREATKRNMPKWWFKGQPKHTHIALDDARGQGMLFMAMLKANQQDVQKEDAEKVRQETVKRLWDRANACPPSEGTDCALAAIHALGHMRLTSMKQP